MHLAIVFANYVNIQPYQNVLAACLLQNYLPHHTKHTVTHGFSRGGWGGCTPHKMLPFDIGFLFNIKNTTQCLNVEITARYLSRVFVFVSAIKFTIFSTFFLASTEWEVASHLINTPQIGLMTHPPLVFTACYYKTL